MRRLPIPILVLAAALLASGCGSKTETVTNVTSVPTATQGTQSTPTVPPIAAPARTQTQPATPPIGSVDQAEARVRAEGYVPDDPSQYHGSQSLRVLVGTKKGSGDGYAKRAFFFVGGRYIGTDTSDDSAGIRVESQSDTQITLGYALYGPSDPLCCPGSAASVRYLWNGSRLVPLDPIPSASKRG